MAYFTELDATNKVLRVITVANEVITDERGFEYEDRGIAFCKQLFGTNTRWVQTSYNTHGGVHAHSGIPLRKNYAGVGFDYDPVRDAFIPPKPTGEGWVLDEQTCLWRNPDREAAAASVVMGATRV